MKKSALKFILKSFLVFILLTSCEDVVDITLDEGTPQLTIDAWLTNQPGVQTIRLTEIASYFDNTANPPALGATVVVTSQEGIIYNFLDDDNDGNYVWTPTEGGVSFGEIGKGYGLAVEYKGETFIAATFMQRVATVDSITFDFEEKSLGTPEGYYGQFYARDFVGENDCYWVKTYKNGTFLGKPQEINIAYDAGTSAGGNVDGLIFIPPIRNGINRFPDLDDSSEDGTDVAPWALGDSVYVELWSITPDTFFFLEQARNQMTNGGLFASPIANVPTNIQNANTNSEVKALGYFCTSAVSSLGSRVEE